MSGSWRYSKAWFYVVISIQWVTLTSIIIIFMIDMHHIIKQFKKVGNKYRLCLIVQILVYITYIIFILLQLVTSMEWTKNCIFDYVVSILYPITKMVLYQLFITRIYVIYSNSFLKYSNKILISFSIFIVIMILLIILLITFDPNAKFYHHHNVGCISTWSFYINAIGAATDFLISFCCLYLFIKPLSFLLHEQPPNVGELYSLIYKYINLTIVSVLSSTICLIILSIIGIGVLVDIDAVINSLCVMFMSQSYTKYYNKLCFSCNECTKIMLKHICCLKLISNDENVLKMIATMSNTSMQSRSRSPSAPEMQSQTQTTTKV